MKTKKANKIILNYMPPGLISMPAIAFSILKSFINQYGYDTQIIYWNQLMFDLVKPYFTGFTTKPTDLDLLFIAPFLFEISEKFKDSALKKRIVAFLKSILPGYEIERKYNSEVIKNTRDNIFLLIDRELEKIEADSVLLFGFSGKFYQWIPAMVLAERLKKKFPGSKMVIGGFGNKDEAGEILLTCRHFDFAIWGEGEYPLLELCSRLEEGTGYFEPVPRLVYREQKDLKVTKSRGKYLSFQEYIYPDFTDFFDVTDLDSFRANCELLIETSRGCYWNRCKFCSFNKGYKYRVRSPQSIVREIEYMFKKYKVTQFRFVDNDIVGKDLERFEILLDMVIESSLNNRVKYRFYAEIIHSGFNSRLIEKLSVAGFTTVQIGYEAITDGLLEKMAKKTDFADHILFVKFSLKFGVSVVGANIIKGIVGETENDVWESIDNLHYLRFFLDKETGNFHHLFIGLRLQGGTRFLKMLKPGERKKWNFSAIGYFLPDSLINNERRFNLLGFTREFENKTGWEYFEKVNKFYEDTEITYQILENKGIYYYSEFMEGRRINYIVFNEPEHWEVLKAANDEVSSFEKIFDQLKAKFPHLTEKRLDNIVRKLKSHHLIYSNKDQTRIVSIIDTGNLK